MSHNRMRSRYGRFSLQVFVTWSMELLTVKHFGSNYVLYESTIFVDNVHKFFHGKCEVILANGFLFHNF
jgi:hypothetical protein